MGAEASDPTLDFFSKGAAQAPPPSSGDPTLDFFSNNTPVVLPHDDIHGEQPASQYNDTGLGGAALHAVSGIGASIIGGWRGISELAQGHGLDAAADAVREEQEKRTFKPEKGSDAEAIVNAAGSAYNPLTWPSRGIDYAADKAFELTGSPALATTLKTGANAALMLAGGRGAGALEEPAAVPKLTETGAPAAEAAPAAAAPGAPAAAAETEARGGYFEPTDTATPPKFEAAAPVAEQGSLLPEAEQAQREAILKRVGVTETRNSAIEGNGQAAANEYQESKLTSPNGVRMKGVLDAEKQALSDHADTITKDTGGTSGSATDENIKTERGNNMIAPLDGLKDYFDKATSQLYKEADARAAGVPADLGGFRGIVGDASELTNSDRVHLVNGINAYAKKIGINVAEDGSMQGTVAQAETMRKYLNENWSPANSKLVGKLKDALDDDVTQAAGSDVYAQARAMRSLRGRTLDDPNGISKLMDSSGPEGINRKVPIENIPDFITRLPVAQLDHVIGTLKNLPPELAEQGAAALNEIKAHMASKVADAGKVKSAGQWNAANVTDFLSKNSKRMQMLFTPEELAKFGDLNDAGNILKKDQGYPGAAVQEHNLVKAGAMNALRTGGAAAGSHFGPAGAIAGGFVGGKAAGLLDSAMLRRNVESRIKQL